MSFSTSKITVQQIPFSNKKVVCPVKMEYQFDIFQGQYLLIAMVLHLCSPQERLIISTCKLAAAIFYGNVQHKKCWRAIYLGKHAKLC